MIVHQNLLEHLGMDTRIQRIVISSGNWGGQDLKIGLQEMLDGREDIVLVSYVDLKRELEEKKNMISAISHRFLLVIPQDNLSPPRLGMKQPQCRNFQIATVSFPAVV